MTRCTDYKTTPLWNIKLSAEERLDYLLGELTLEEKLQCLGTGCPRIERLGIEPFSLGTEGAHGLQKRHDQSFDRGEPQPTTIFPNPIGMSATWDTELLRQAGEVVGKEARAVYEKEGREGGLCLWAPTVDMERDPRWGRTEEAYGEDPYLTGKMASAYIRGMRGDSTSSDSVSGGAAGSSCEESDGEHHREFSGDSCGESDGEHHREVSESRYDKTDRIRCGATLKHFYANNVEDGRVWKSSSVDPRNKYEYYLEPFRRAVVEGGAEGIMTAYNEINGVPAILNTEVQRIAKEEWGLHHVVCDGGDMKQTVDFHQYFGSHTETIAAGLKAGVDCFTDDSEAVMEGAGEALELGLIEMSDIDRALRCHFGTMIRLGIFDATEAAEEYGLNLPEHQEIARRLTRESVVLLKNEPVDGRRLLPLRAEDYGVPETVGDSVNQAAEDSVSKAAEAGVSGAAKASVNQVTEDGASGGVEDVVNRNAEGEAVTAKRLLAVVGPSADAWFMDWYSGTPPYSVTPLQGIREMAEVSFESGLPQIKLACGEGYLGLLPDGRTLGLVEEAAAAEVFEVTLWDKEQITLRAMSNGLLLTAEDGKDEEEVYCDGTITATKEAAFGWFVREAFRVGGSLTELTNPVSLSSEHKETVGINSMDTSATLSLEIGDQFQQLLENGSEIILQSWNEGNLYLDEQNRVRLQEPEGFVEQGEPRRVISFIGEDGRRTSVRGYSKDFAGRSGVFETVTGARYRTLPPVRPVLVHDGVRAAQELAANSDTVIFAGGSHPMITCKEEVDRKDIDFPPFQREILRAMYQVNPRIILVLITNVPYAITWEEEHLPAILTMAGGSMELGHGLADILFGVQAPAGRLNMTWYRDTEQLPDMDDYDIIQGERTYQYFRGEVLYPFGHGLTYAEVTIDDMSVERTAVEPDDAEGMPLERTADKPNDAGDMPLEQTAGELGVTRDLSMEQTAGEPGVAGDMVWVSCTVTNCGLAGADALVQDEVVQLYVTKLASAVKRPLRQLVGFRRVRALKAGESRRVVFEVPVSDLRYYDTIQRRMLVEPGEYEFQLGSSSQAIAARRTISLPGEPRGQRDGSKWQPADHYDRSRNGYLWEGHMGYTSVVHRGKAASSTDLFEEVDHLWQNVNEVTRMEAKGNGQDDSLLIEYDRVHIPAGAATLLLDADAGEEAGVDVYLGEDYAAGYIVSDGKLSAEQEDLCRTDGAAGEAGRHGRIFRQHAIALGIPTPAEKEPEEEANAQRTEPAAENPGGWTGTLRLKCYGDIRICRWKFV